MTFSTGTSTFSTVEICLRGLFRFTSKRLLDVSLHVHSLAGPRFGLYIPIQWNEIYAMESRQFRRVFSLRVFAFCWCLPVTKSGLFSGTLSTIFALAGFPVLRSTWPHPTFKVAMILWLVQVPRAIPLIYVTHPQTMMLQRTNSLPLARSTSLPLKHANNNGSTSTS